MYSLRRCEISRGENAQGRCRCQARVPGTKVCLPAVIGKSGGERGMDKRRWGVDVEVDMDGHMTQGDAD